MSANPVLERQSAQGNLTGFGNLVSRESRKWWRTRRWLVQIIVWLFILVGFTLFGLYVMPDLVMQTEQAMAEAERSGAEMMSPEEFQRDVPNALFGLAAFALPVGIIVLTQNQVFAEKRSGVTAWIMSKPVARPAYLLAKLVADGIGIILLMVLLPLTIAYLPLASTLGIDPGSYILAMGLLLILLLFYQTLTLMMSVLGSSTEAILAIPLGLLLSGLFLRNLVSGFLGDAIFVTPWVMSDAMGLTLMGQSLPSQYLITIIALPAMTLIFLGIMFWRFQKQEL